MVVATTSVALLTRGRAVACRVVVVTLGTFGIGWEGILMKGGQ